MANIRDFKKGVAYLANDLVTTLCVKNAQKGSDNDKTADLIVKAIALKAEFIKKVNNIENPHDKKAIKAYFAQVKKDLTDKASELVKAINEL